MRLSCSRVAASVRLWWLLFVLLAALTLPRLSAVTYYVSPAGSGDGSTTNAPAKGSVEQLGLWLTNTNPDHLDLTIVFMPGNYPLVRSNANFDWLGRGQLLHRQHLSNSRRILETQKSDINQ